MWSHDGTTATLIQIGDGTGSFPEDFTIHNNELFFDATDGVHGTELWKYDGQSVSLVEDVAVGTTGSSPYNFFSFGPMFYFSAEVDNQYNIYRYNGVDTELVVANMEMSDFEDYFQGVELDGYYYFSAYSEQYGGEEIWRIRQTSEETDITTFSFAEQTGVAIINEEDHTVIIETAAGTDLSQLNPNHHHFRFCLYRSRYYSPGFYFSSHLHSNSRIWQYPDLDDYDRSG